jgi:hypothetical protein
VGGDGGGTSGVGAGVTGAGTAGRSGGEVGVAGTIGPVGPVAQPAISASRASDRRAAARPLQSRLANWLRALAAGNSIMGWILLEAAVALAIGLFIVWWTWPRKK